jgi:hypothetical protein
MASFVVIAIATSAAFGILFGAFFRICYIINREDRHGTVVGSAPTRACMSARHIAGWHRLRWDTTGPRRPAIAY